MHCARAQLLRLRYSCLGLMSRAIASVLQLPKQVLQILGIPRGSKPLGLRSTVDAIVLIQHRKSQATDPHQVFSSASGSNLTFVLRRLRPAANATRSRSANVGTRLADCFCNVGLTTNRVNGDSAPLRDERLQQLRDCLNFVGAVLRSTLAQGQALSASPRFN